MTDVDLIEMRCRACGTLLGYRKRLGVFSFWCSEPCANTPMPKYEETQIRDEVATELYLGGMRMMDVTRFTENDYYAVIQQMLVRKGVVLGQAAGPYSRELEEESA